MIEVVLSNVELERAFVETRFRVERVIRQKLGKGHGEAGRDRNALIRRHTPGCLGECALAQWLGVSWEGGRNNFATYADVAGIEARASFHERPHLIIFPSDPPARRIVLVRLRAASPVCWLLGWVTADAVKCSQYDPPAKVLRPGSPQQWWVPSHKLEDMGSFGRRARQ